MPKATKKTTSRAKKTARVRADVECEIPDWVTEIKQELSSTSCGCKKSKCHSSSGIYCLGVIGSLFYFVGTATTFWGGVLGVLKALIWPAILVFELLRFLGL